VKQKVKKCDRSTQNAIEEKKNDRARRMKQKEKKNDRSTQNAMEREER
jgi:hypothetical protein